MDQNGRYDHIEDVLVHLHRGQWFGWSDSKDKIYSNLVIHNSDYDKPTEKSLTDDLVKQQSDFDTNQYQRDRQYPDLGEQLDMQYHDQLDGTTTWKDAVAKVKADNPKPQE